MRYIRRFLEVSSMGAMGESSRKVQKASTYIGSLVGVDVTSTQVDSTTITYVEASTLPSAEHGKCPGRFPHGGWGKVQGRFG